VIITIQIERRELLQMQDWEFAVSLYEEKEKHITEGSFTPDAAMQCCSVHAVPYGITL